MNIGTPWDQTQSISTPQISRDEPSKSENHFIKEQSLFNAK
jgi:hypothetical protein